MIYCLLTQVDYVNAFADADLDRPVFVKLPSGFNHSNDVPCILWLKKSLYGMSNAPLMFFESTSMWTLVSLSTRRQSALPTLMIAYGLVWMVPYLMH